MNYPQLQGRNAHIYTLHPHTVQLDTLISLRASFSCIGGEFIPIGILRLHNLENPLYAENLLFIGRRTRTLDGAGTHGRTDGWMEVACPVLESSPRQILIEYTFGIKALRGTVPTPLHSVGQELLCLYSILTPAIPPPLQFVICGTNIRNLERFDF